MTWLAPASKYFPAVSGVTPPALLAFNTVHECTETRPSIIRPQRKYLRTSDLQPLRVSLERRQRRLLAPGPEHYHVPALEPVRLVHPVIWMWMWIQ